MIVTISEKEFWEIDFGGSIGWDFRRFEYAATRDGWEWRVIESITLPHEVIGKTVLVQE